MHSFLSAVLAITLLSSCMITDEKGGQVTDPDTAFLYNSCKESLTLNNKDLEKNYCYQMISAIFPALYIRKAFLIPENLGSGKSCETQKFSAYYDLMGRAPHAKGYNFSHEGIARSFIDFIESKSSIRKFDLLHSPADAAMAQSITDGWKILRSNTKPDVLPLPEKDQLRIARTMSDGITTAKELTSSCKVNFSHGFKTSLCHASISGALVAYSIVKTERPVYTDTDACRKEKEEVIDSYMREATGCFPEKDVKREVAYNLIIGKGRFSPKVTASLAAAQITSSIYICVDGRMPDYSTVYTTNE